MSFLTQVSPSAQTWAKERLRDYLHLEDLCIGILTLHMYGIDKLYCSDFKIYSWTCKQSQAFCVMLAPVWAVQ